MIVIEPATPRWIRELERYLPLKSLLFLQGNVLDLVAYPVRRPAGPASYWTESSLPAFFERYLQGLGYEVIGLFDPVDGLRFPDNRMQALFEVISKPLPDTHAIERIRTQQAVEQAAQPTGNNRRQITEPEEAVRLIQVAVANTLVPCAFVFPFASRLLTAPDHLSARELALFTRLLKLSLDAQTVYTAERALNNALILVCDKLNDLPPFLYLDNPRSRSITLDRPGSAERSRFFESSYGGFYGVAAGEAPPAELTSLFAALTDGLAYYELMSLIALSRREQLPANEIRTICERYKYGVTESDWDKLSRTRLERAEDFIRARIKGQDAAVARLLELIKRAALGLEAGSVRRSQRPRGVLFFAGPTGVGKTEMAKSLAALLFGEAERLIRFDMSEFAHAHADQRLLGSPPGYVGFDEGGKLTNAVKKQPFSVLLFDEIEKAHPSIFDQFLQILDDGRLTDGKGETVYFSESIIVFTSNLGTVAQDHETGERRQLVTPDMPYSQVRALMLKTIEDHFNLVMGRPEILNRFGDNFVVFDFIRPPVDELILDQLLQGLQASLAETRDIGLSWTAAVREQLVAQARQHLAHGGRGVRNALDTALVNPLASVLFDQAVMAGQQVHIRGLSDHGEEAAHRFVLDVAITPQAAEYDA